MWGGGFWGTQREKQWRQRAQSLLLRQRQQQEGNESAGAAAAAGPTREELQKRHEQELKGKDHVLDLTRRLLVQARGSSDEQQQQQGQKRAAAAAGAEGADDDADDGDKKPSAAVHDNKKPRVDPPSNNHQHEGMGDEDDEEDAAAVNAVVVPPLASLSRKISGEVIGREGGASSAASAAAAALGRDGGGLPAVRENLLALTYAMFDTLYGTNSFQVKPFCDFLIKQGERDMAEMIALAAVDKSRGSGPDIRYILYNLAPKSKDKNQLVTTVTEILQADDANEDGNLVLMGWQNRHLDSEQAFHQALRTKDELKRVKLAYPYLEGKAERRQQLKKSATLLCDERIIGVFDDEDWPTFLITVNIPVAPQGFLRPSLPDYIRYAAARMVRPKGTAVAKKVLSEFIHRLAENTRKLWQDLVLNVAMPDGSPNSVCNARDTAHVSMSTCLTKLQNDISSIRLIIESLSVSVPEIVAQCVSSRLDLPPQTTACKSGHRHFKEAFACKVCRRAALEAAWTLGVVGSLREHKLTKDEPSCLAVGSSPVPGFGCTGYPFRHSVVVGGQLWRRGFQTPN